MRKYVILLHIYKYFLILILDVYELTHHSIPALPRSFQRLISTVVIP